MSTNLLIIAHIECILTCKMVMGCLCTHARIVHVSVVKSSPTQDDCLLYCVGLHLAYPNRQVCKRCIVGSIDDFKIFTHCQTSTGHEGLSWLQHVAYYHAIEIGYVFPWCCMRKSYTHQIFALDSSWPTHTGGRT